MRLERPRRVSLGVGLGFLALTGCQREEGALAKPVDFVSGPTVRENVDAGLTAWLEVSLSAPCALSIELTHEDRTTALHSAMSEDHRVLLLGLRPDTVHGLRVRALDAQKRTVAEQALVYETGPLPDDFFQWQMQVAEPERMEPGVTLVGFGRYLVALDPEGFPIWYLPAPGAIHEANALHNGHLLVVVGRTAIYEVALDGTIARSWQAARTERITAQQLERGAIALDVEATHHDAIELPDGHLVSLSIERRWVEGYPTSESDPLAPRAGAWVAGDVVVEFSPEGEVIHRWPLLDLLDPTRIGYDAVKGDFWEDFGPWRGEDIKDWSHGNALSYDPRTDTLIVGLRHQDAVIALSRSTGELSWIVAPPAHWPPALQDKLLLPAEPDFVYAFHPHGAEITPQGTLLLFDNGNRRASAYEPPLPDQDNFSRALELALHLAEGTYTTAFEYGRELKPSHYAGSLGDADALPVTGNTLLTFGNLAHSELGGVRLMEVTREREIVWDLVVPREEATTQRAQRVTGLFPGL